ncbi:hypothetical protein HHI36_001272 [Cryptolaemus montrouzieri]|uniref:Uncharacterized protein n=1 Tax=Cryptolaemus montrouzieri TaxID=559131 RepID=A0ABD2P737_9CUCU
MCEAFIKLSKSDEDILNNMIDYCRSHASKIKTENDVFNLLEESIIYSTNLFLNENFQNSLEENDDFDRLIQEAVCFAKALGQKNIENGLLECNLFSMRKLDTRNGKFLKRIFLIRKLIHGEYTMKNAIERLKKNTDQAKFDPRIRKMIRESGVLLSDGFSLMNSKTIPLQLLKPENLLGLEDFIVQRIKITYPILIIRNDMQAVIPREALQGVQSGRVPYVLIDESGISNFKPLHTLAAMKGSKNSEHVTSNNYFKFNGDIDYSVDSRASMNFA